MILRPTIISALLVFGLILSSSTCRKPGMGNDPCEGAVCTMIFASVAVKVQDASGNAVSLDSCITVLKSNGYIVRKSNTQVMNGFYTVVDDSYQKQIANRSEDFIFTGYKSGSKIVSGDFTVSADCCHISRMSGPEVLLVK